MRTFIAISIAFIVFGLAGFYVYDRVVLAFADTFVTSIPVLIIYIFVLASFFVGKILERSSINLFNTILIKIGSVGAGVFLYAFISVVLIDFVRLINYIIPFYPTFMTANIEKTKLIVGLIDVGIVFVICTIGYLNTRSPVTRTVEFTINKNVTGMESLNVVAVSDIHLGTIVNQAKTKRLITAINKLNPDLVLIAGDMIDDNINVVKHFKLLKHFKNIKSKYGVYACPGNHEYYSRAYLSFSTFEENGINILKDKSVIIDNKFYVIGRDDKEVSSITRKPRKSLEILTENIDLKLPTLLLDHQPYKLNETANHQIDLQFSGHTHKGQIWPFNFITKSIFESHYGYLKKEQTNFFISSGFGTAVMPMRLGSKSEIINFKIKFKNA